MNLIKGNYNSIVIGPLRDSDNVIIANLATAIDVRFAIKIDPEDSDLDAKVMKALLSGVTVDDPTTGCITVQILPADTDDLDAGMYYFGCQVEYSSTNIQELLLKESGKVINTFNLTQDVVRKP
jgi:hypothetical protein